MWFGFHRVLWDLQAETDYLDQEESQWVIFKKAAPLKQQADAEHCRADG